MTKKVSQAKTESMKAKLLKEYERGWQEGNGHGYNNGFVQGGAQMEQAKLGGIADLQRQLDASRAEVAALKKQRREALYAFLSGLGV